MFNQPKLSELLLYLLGGIACGGVSAALKNNGIWSDVFLFAACAFGVISVFAFAYWLKEQWLDTLQQYRQVMCITPEQKLIDTAARLTDGQIALLNQQTPILRVLAGNEGPMMMLQVGEMEVPFTFVREFMGYNRRDDNGLDWLKPIRDHEGKTNQDYAKAFTDWLVSLGFALKYAGNNSARWVDRQMAMKWLGLG